MNAVPKIARMRSQSKSRNMNDTASTMNERCPDRRGVRRPNLSGLQCVRTCELGAAAGVMVVAAQRDAHGVLLSHEAVDLRRGAARKAAAVAAAVVRVSRIVAVTERGAAHSPSSCAPVHVRARASKSRVRSRSYRDVKIGRGHRHVEPQATARQWLRDRCERSSACASRQRAPS
jgi:hypothetical protein